MNELGGTKNNISTDSEPMTIKELFQLIKEFNKYLLSKWVIILIFGISGGIAGVVYAIYQRTLYSADLTFAIEDSSSSGGGLGGALGIASQFGVDLGGGGSGVFSGDNLIALLKSRSIIERSLLKPITKSNGHKTTLATIYLDFMKLNSSQSLVMFPVNASRSSFSLKQDSMLGVLYRNILDKNLSVERKDKKLAIISVSVKSESEFFSKRFCEVLVEQVSDFYVSTKTKKSVENVAILQNQTDSVRRELNAAISGVAVSLDANPNANPARQILLAPSQRRTVDVEANRAILTELVKNLEMSKITLRKETPLIQVIDAPVLPLQKEEYGKKIGAFVGGSIGGFLVVFFLVIRKLLIDHIL